MSDWTAMDPAILSFRQFPSYPSHQQHDMFMHLNPQSGQGEFYYDFDKIWEGA